MMNMDKYKQFIKDIPKSVHEEEKNNPIRYSGNHLRTAIIHGRQDLVSLLGSCMCLLKNQDKILSNHVYTNIILTIIALILFFKLN